MESIDVNHWIDEVNRAVSLQQTQHHKWKEAFWFYEGTWFDRNLFMRTNDATPVNYATSFVGTLIPAIYSRDPYIFVKSNQSKYAQFSQNMETVLNYFWRELDLKTQIKRVLKDAIIFGLGWIETGYWAEFNTLQLKSQTKENQIDELIDLIGKKEKESVPEEEGVLSEYIRKESAYAIRLSPYKVFLTPGYHDIHSMPYLIIAEDMSPIDLANHPLYKSKSKNIKPTRTIGIETRDLQMSTSFRPTPSRPNDAQMMIRLYHIFDRRNQIRFTIAENNKEVLAKSDWPYCFDGFPQIPLIFNEIPETDVNVNNYPMSDITPMIPQLRELYWLRTAMVRHRKRSGTVIMIDKNQWDAETMRKFETEYDVAIIPVPDVRSVVNHSPPELPQIVYNLNNIILQDLDRQSGLTQLLLAQGQSDRTATETNYLASGAQIKTSEKIDVIEKFSIDIARRLAAIIWEYYPQDRIAQILGETFLTNSMWPELPDLKSAKTELIQRELAFRIEAGATQPPRNKAVEREQKLRFINIASAFAPDRIKKDEVLKELADDFDFKEYESWIIGHDDEEKKVALKENQLLLRNIPQIVSPNELHLIHLQIHAQASLQGNSTQTLDEHILEHKKYLDQKMPARGNQTDDLSPAGGAAVPEINRMGMPDYTDIISSIGKIAGERGLEKGGIPNI